MDFNFKKIWPTAAISLVAVTSLLSADYDDAQMRNLENRVNALEQRRGANGILNPPARPPVSYDSDLFVTADFLWWKPTENGLDYVIKNEGSTDFVSSGKVRSPNFKWDPGFRVGVGYNMCHDGWDLYANWTHFRTKAKGHANSPLGGTLFPVWENPSDFQGPVPVDEMGFITSARTNWKLRLDQIDLSLGREFFVSKWLTLRPHIGLRTDWIHQKDTIHYVGTTGNLVPSASVDHQISLKDRYWGLGLVGGLNTQWGLGEGFSIYGDLDAAILAGHFRISERETELVSNTNRLHVKNSYQLGRAILDLAAGLRWQASFGCDDAFAFLIQAGWENHIYFGQNQLLRFVDDFTPGLQVSNLGDLTFQGWTLSARFDF